MRLLPRRPPTDPSPARVQGHPPADEEFRAVIMAAAPAGEPDLVGVEHEYAVDTAGRQIPFRPLIHTLELGVRHLQPDDPHAYPIPSGAVLSADGNEALIALPPALVAPGFSEASARTAERERRSLIHRLGPAHGLRGHSTRLSVRTLDFAGDWIAAVMASRFAAPMMLLLDRATSPGLLIRPRSWRTQVEGEFIVGPQLSAALVFVAAAVRTSVAMGLSGEHRERELPKVRALVVPAAPHFGWYVDRSAFACDLHGSGRAARLRTVDGRTLSAQAVLENAWTVVRPAVAGSAGTEELHLVDGVVSGRLPLPLEGDMGPAGIDITPLRRGRGPGAAGDEASDIGWLRPRHRAKVGVELAPVMITWETVVLLIVDEQRRRRAFAVIPRHLLTAALRLLDAGRLDGPISEYMRHSKGDRVLTSNAQTRQPGLFDSLPSRGALVPPEREPSEQGAFQLA
ncbi:MAG: hypothetical protein WCB85_12810 [Candidatus Dormiibacterota bacterium]